MNLVTHLSPSDGAALLLAVALKGTLLFLIAFVAAGVLRRASAATRHAVFAAALAAALVLPALFAVLPGWQVPVLPGRAAASAVPIPPAPPVAPQAPVAPPTPRAWLVPPAPPSPPAGLRAEARVYHENAFVWEHRTFADPAEAVVEAVTAVPASLPVPLRDWRVWMLLVWAAGAVAVAARWLLASFAAQRLVQQAEPVYDLEWLELKERVAFGLGLDRPVRLLRSDRIAVPVACGVGAPVVLLPGDADAWPEDRREVVLTHELAHVLRRDCLTQLVAQAALALHWFNPLAWLAYRRFLLEREHACDDYVLNHGARASDYADHLVEIARRFRREPLALAATAPMARRSNLEGRIRSILDAGQNRQAASRWALAALGVLALAVVLPLAAFQPVGGGADEPVPGIAPAEPLPVSPPELGALALSDDTFRWEGRVAAGGFVEVYGINGSVRAATGSGDRVRVEAEKTSDRGGEDEVEIIVNELANGVVVCAVYPGQRGGCRPGQGAQGNVRDNDVSVRFEITLPETVRFVAHTVNGSVKTEPLGGDVEAQTVNGSIETASRRGDVTAKTVNGSVRAEAAGVVRAETVNGSITARLGRTDWDGTLDLSTTNGSITLTLPSDLNATVHAEAGTGSITSDFPLTVRRDGYTGASAEGRIGSGGRRLNATVLNGSIKLRRAGTGIGAVQTRDRQRRVAEQARLTEEQMRRIEEQTWQAHEQNLDLVGQALAGIGPIMEQAMAEAGRAMAAIDFEGEVASALTEVDWHEVQHDVEDALREAEAERAWSYEHGEDWEEQREESWDAAEDDIADALNGIRSELADIEDGLAEADANEVPALRIVERALREAERGLEQALRDARRRHGRCADEDCSDDR